MNVYIKALIPTIFVFLIGIMIGIWIENYRLRETRKALSEFEIIWNDAQLLNKYLEKMGNESCDLAFQQNLIFNDKIYKKGLEIEKMLKANLFTPEIIQEWTRYVLLQIQFWFNSIELRQRCNLDYHTAVHLYNIKISPIEKAENDVQSAVMLELKYKCGAKMMLIPLTADVDLIVVDSVLKKYNITKLPAIIIDEKYVFQGLTSLEQLEKIVKC